MWQAVVSGIVAGAALNFSGCHPFVCITFAVGMVAKLFDTRAAFVSDTVSVDIIPDIALFHLSIYKLVYFRNNRI